jgi:hypothetical protein
MATPIFPDGSIVGSDGSTQLAQAIPFGKTVANPTHAVSLTLSNGETVLIGSVSECLRLITRMRSWQQWLLSPQENILIMLAGGGEKLIVAEATNMNVRLASQFAPVYFQGNLGWMRRGGAIMSTSEALQAVGHFKRGGSVYRSTHDLKTPVGSANPRLVVFDYAWKADSASYDQGTQLADSPPLTWSFSGALF